MGRKEIEYMIEEGLVTVAIQNGSLKVMDLIRYYQEQYNEVWLVLKRVIIMHHLN